MAGEDRLISIRDIDYHQAVPVRDHVGKVVIDGDVIGVTLERQGVFKIRPAGLDDRLRVPELFVDVQLYVGLLSCRDLDGGCGSAGEGCLWMG